MVNTNQITRIATWCLGTLLLLQLNGCAFKGMPKFVSRKMQISAGAACPGCQQVECVCEVDGRCAGYQATKWSFLDGCGNIPQDTSAPSQQKEEIPAPKGTDAGEDEAPAPPSDRPPSIPPTRPEDEVPGLLPDEPTAPPDEPFPQKPAPSDDNTPPLFPPDRPALPPAKPESDSPSEEPAPAEEPAETPEPELFPEDAPKPAPKGEPKAPAKPPTKPAPPAADELFPEEPKKPTKKPATAPKTDIDDLFKDDAPASKPKPKRPAPPTTDDLFPAEKSKSPADPSRETKPSIPKPQPQRSSAAPKPTDKSDLFPNRSLPQSRAGGVSAPITSPQAGPAPAVNSMSIRRDAALAPDASATHSVVKVSHDEVRFLPAADEQGETERSEPTASDVEIDMADLESADTDDFGIEVP